MKIDNETLIFDLLVSNNKSHIPRSELYNKLDIYYKSYFIDHSKKKQSQLFIPRIGKFKLPFYKMGNINSSHLLGLDEIIIFTIYFLLKGKIKNVADLGANIGMHSIILGKLGFKVRSYEPEPNHLNQLNKNIKLNKLNNVKIFEKAVDVKKGVATFTKLLNNTTGSFINKAKSKTYGPIEQFEVKTESFKEILKWADLVKMDVEGMESKLICSISKKDLINKIIILEVGSHKNARDIFNFIKKNKIHSYSQKNAWRQTITFKDMPLSYKDGSLIISYRPIDFYS